MLGKNLRSLWIETDPDKAIARARRAVERGRPDSAIAGLKEALQAGKEDLRLRLELSHLLVNAGQIREAAEGIRSLLKFHPEDHGQVRDFIGWARGTHQDVQPLYEVLGEHYVSRRDFASALEALEKVEKKSLQILLDAKLANLKRFLDKSPHGLPRSAVPLLYFAAIICEAQGDHPKAVEHYRQIAAAVPSEMPAIQDRLKGILSKNFRSPSLRSALAEVHLAAKDTGRALEEYVQMVEVDPRTAASAAEAVEQIASQAADPAPALFALARIRKHENTVEELLQAGARLIETGKHLDELVAILEGMLVDGKQDPRIHLLIGEASLRAGKIPRATTAFSAAAAHPSPEVRARAREALQRAVGEHPGERKAAETLAEHLLKDARYDECVDLLGKIYASNLDAAPHVASRLQTILLSRPGHQGAEALLEKLAPVLEDVPLASAILRKRLRVGPAEAASALEGIEKLLAREPQDRDLLLAASEAHAARGDMERAWEFARPLVDGAAGSDPALLHLLVLIGGSSRPLSRTVADCLSSSAPELAASPEGVFALGEMCALAGEIPAAVAHLRSAAAFSPEAAAEVVATLRGTGGEALSGETAVALAEGLLNAGDPQGAASVLASATGLPAGASRTLGRIEEALGTRPEDVEMRVALASALAAAGRGDRARAIVEEGIRLAGDAAPATLFLAQGDVWLREGNLGESVKCYSRAMAKERSLAAESARRIERVLAVDVGHPSAHLALGRARLLDGRPVDGVNELLTAWSIRPGSGSVILKDLDYASRVFPLEPQVNLARSQILLGLGEVESAADALGSALCTSPSIVNEVLIRLQPMARSHPSCARARFHAGKAWQIKGRCAEASEAYLAAAELDPSLAEPCGAALSECMRDHPDRPEPHLARARLHEAQGSPGPAAEACLAAAEKGADREQAIAALRDIAAKEGPHRGKAHQMLGRALRRYGVPGEAAAAFVQAAELAPETLPALRDEVDAIVRDQPDCAEAVVARARLRLASMQPRAALDDLETILTRFPSVSREAADLASRILSAGGEEDARCVWTAARALLAAGEIDEAARILDDWAGRAPVDLRSRMLLARARVERERGNENEARRFLSEAESYAPDRSVFLSDRHAESIASARAVAARTADPSDRWKALQACLDLGDTEKAESLAFDLGVLTKEGAVPKAEPAALEAVGGILCLRGRYGAAADLLAAGPPSNLKAHALRRAGRFMEAAACLADLDPPAGAPSHAARSIYRSLAAGSLLKEPYCIEAETHIDFSAGKDEPEP